MSQAEEIFSKYFNPEPGATIILSEVVKTCVELRDYAEELEETNRQLEIQIQSLEDESESLEEDILDLKSELKHEKSKG